MTDSNTPRITGTPKDIPGTTIFDGEMSIKGYALNKMCFSFNKAENREAFVKNPQEYCAKYQLSDAQTNAVLQKDLLKLIDEGGSIYYLAKLAGIFGMNMQDCGAAQRGISLEEFNQMLAESGK